MKAYAHNSPKDGRTKMAYSCGYCGSKVKKAYVYHFNGNTGGGETLPASNMSLSEVVAPSAVKQGNAFSIYGTISSEYRINYVAVAIKDFDCNNVLLKQVAPGTYSYNVHSIDNDIPFGTLSPGTYYYQIEAKDASSSIIL